MTSTTTPALAHYRDHAGLLGARYQALTTKDVIAPVAQHLPPSSARIIDIGAGSGRDAVWFAKMGHRVTGVEPVRELSEQVRRISEGVRVEWITDQLPNLGALTDRNGAYDLCLVSAVWHHLPERERSTALASIAALLRHGGTLLLSLRHGGDVDGSTVFDVDPDDTISIASDAGFDLLERVAAGSIQPQNIAAGVQWTWLALRKRARGRAST